MLLCAISDPCFTLRLLLISPEQRVCAVLTGGVGENSDVPKQAEPNDKDLIYIYSASVA